VCVCVYVWGSQVGAGVVGHRQVKVGRQAGAGQAATGLAASPPSGQGLPLVQRPAARTARLQAGHDHLGQVLLQTLEVLSVGAEGDGDKTMGHTDIESPG